MTTTPVAQRVRRFLDEDAGTFALTSALGTGAFFAREVHALKASAVASTRRLQLAARKTRPVLPAVLVSSAVGIVGMKVTLAAVQDARRDYSRTSLLLAVPLFAAVMHAPGGPRLMAKSAIGYGAFILAADQAAYNWHRYNALQHLEQQQLRDEHDHGDYHPQGHHHLYDVDQLVRRGVAHDTHHGAAFGRDAPMLLPRLGEN